MESKRNKTPRGVFGPEDIQWAKKAPAGWLEGRNTHQGVPRCVVPPSGHPSGTSLAYWMSSGPKKPLKSSAAFGLRLVLIFCEVKNKQKTAICTGHYVNRLVPKNDIKLL